MSVYELADEFTPKGILARISEYMNLEEQPKKVHVTKEALIATAWLMTGKHLRQAMTAYEKELKESQESAKKEASDRRRSS